MLSILSFASLISARTTSVYAVCAVGDLRLAFASRLLAQAKIYECKCLTLLHSTASKLQHVSGGESSIMCVGLIVTMNTNIVYHSILNFGSYRLVMFVIPGNAVEFVSRSKVGISAEPDDPDAFPNTTGQLSAMIEEVEAIVQRGRQLVRRKFSRDVLADQLMSI